ncbi:hypothetical protein GOP47_0010069 [Adiantum capillus-veneris]|uniref:Uncharacterized protein n=1 Tax=Adiantum capillus-veneris TaxID=13818 RepID=A0A9D4ZG00_ADICA|nr:hypothetical protein GOP47_0010069 [Adiantum capillus-veneris]
MEPAVITFVDNGRQSQQPRHYRRKANFVQSMPSALGSNPSSVGAMDAPPSTSNLQRFLTHTTPHVTTQFLSKTQLRNAQGSEMCEKGFFSLNDLWESFGEWSAYGVGVPILLDHKETVMQYYVPYLSGIQLYAHTVNTQIPKSRSRLGDDSDGSEMDFRDSSSETSSCDGELERLSDQVSWNSSDVGDRVPEGEMLIFEYFESAPPSLRVPLSDKVKELSAVFHGLRNLCSNDLSRSSWLSVAWYPIYRIPTGPTLKDLAACFLTYHSLSTLFTDDRSKLPETLSSDGTRVALYPFGLSGYKFRGPVWTSAGVIDCHNVNLLHRTCVEWLKRLYVHHPDFEYFKSHCTPVHRHG